MTALKHRIEVDHGAHVAARTLGLNEIGYCNLSTAQPIAFDPYRVSRETGGFILIDRFTNETAGAGMIDFALRRASNIHRQAETVSAGERALAQTTASTVQIDCAKVTGADSAGLAVLVDWVAVARRAGRVLHFNHLPEAILAVAAISEVESLFA